MRLISIDHGSSGEIKAYLNALSKKLLDDNGINYELQTHPGRSTPKNEVKMGAPAPQWNVYPTYQEYLDLMQLMADSFPALCQKIDIGNSVNGKKLLFLKISDNVSQDEAEPEFMYSATIHGDETAGYVFTLRLAYELLSDYGSDPVATRLIDSLEIYINPLANPDGTYANSDTSIWGATRFNANGFDLNRNFPDPENGNLPGGPRQIEALNMMNFMEGLNIHMSANLHGGTEVLNYPWDTWQKRHADDNWFIHICREYADSAQAASPSGYMTFQNNGITNGYDWYTIAGGRQDYTTFFLRGREVTFELSNSKVLPSSQLENYYGYNRSGMLNYMAQALYGLQGKVKDSLSGAPLQASVNIPTHDKDQSSVFSDSIHGFYVRYLDSGNYDLVFSAPGYISKSISGVRINHHKKTLLNVSLLPNFAAIVNPSKSPIQVWPNPTNGRINLQIEPSQFTSQELWVIDAEGRRIGKYWIPGNRFSLDLTAFGPGIYFLRLNSESGSFTRKIVLDP